MESKPSAKIQHPKRFYPFDWAAIAALGLLLGILGGLIIVGFYLAPKVEDFSWQGKFISARDRSFTLTFEQPMERESVEANLQIMPKLPGKISWSDRQLHYTPIAPPRYGTPYKVQLQGAKVAYGEAGRPGKRLQPFQGQFQTRDRVFVYLGVEGKERDKLILANLTQQKTTILTPPDLIVVDFKPYPDGQRILFSAVGRNAFDRNLTQLQLYTATTGLNFNPEEPTQPPGRIQQILDAKTYQNLQFDLSADGKIILVERASRTDPDDVSLWIFPQGGEGRSLGLQGEVFALLPQGERVAVAQDRGISLIPVTPTAKPLEFLPGYEAIAGFSPNSSAMLLLRPRADGTRSLILLDEAGKKTELLRTTGLIRHCLFSPQQENILYCLKIRRDLEIDGEEEPTEQPVLSAIDIEERTEIPFLKLANSQDVILDMAPDGWGILFDQVVESTSSQRGTQIEASIWYLPLPKIVPNQAPKIEPPEELIPGFNPVWIP